MRRLAVVAALAVVVAGCTAPVAAPRAQGGPAAKPTTTTTEPAPEPITPTTTEPPTISALSLPDQVSLTLIDLDQFWTEALPATYGIEYEPVNVLGGYDVRADGPPACDSQLIEEAIAIGNAFYCPPDDTIGWDEVELFPTLYDDFGPFAVSLVLAHEWGHAIQARAEVRLPTIFSELQADCLAGAWAGHSLDGGLVSVGPAELDVATAGLLFFRDPVEGSAFAPNAHGNGFDRVGAFTDGLRGGVATCATYVDDRPEVTQIGLSEAELESGGNLPKAEVFPQLAPTLDVWWSGVMESAGAAWDAFDDVAIVGADGAAPCALIDDASLQYGFGYCPAEDLLVLDVDGTIDPLYDAFGDFGPALVMGNAWAAKAQSLLGVAGDDAASDLQLDCFAGAWAGDGRILFDEDGNVTQRGLPTGELDEDGEPLTIRLSAGDLDEAIQSILFLGEETAGGATAFERVESFRTGVLGGAAACLAP